jgi:hypothetical protein
LSAGFLLPYNKLSTSDMSEAHAYNITEALDRE